MNAAPSADMSSGKLSVELMSAVTDRTAYFDCIVDANDFAEVLGIEILAFREQIGSTPPPPPALEQNLARWSYDAGSDSLYIWLANGIKAQRQHKCRGLAFLDKEGVAGKIEVSLTLG
jgi:uncharacterized protein YuzE